MRTEPELSQTRGEAWDPQERGRVPRISSWILGWVLTTYSDGPLLGDLEEEYRWLRRERGNTAARRWYRRQALRSLPLLIKNLVYWSLQMIKNYLKVALRNIARHKGYSFINITGLAIGMACCILILMWVQDELSFDRFHENAGDIYRVIQDINFADHSTTWAITHGPLGPALKNDFPEIIDMVRFTRRGMRLSYLEKTFDETLAMADGSIFEVFSFPLLRGDPEQALKDPFSLVLTEEMARKYFGDEDPLGRSSRRTTASSSRSRESLRRFPSTPTSASISLSPLSSAGSSTTRWTAGETASSLPMFNCRRGFRQKQ